MEADRGTEEQQNKCNNDKEGQRTWPHKARFFLFLFGRDPRIEAAAEEEKFLELAQLIGYD